MSRMGYLALGFALLFSSSCGGAGVARMDGGLDAIEEPSDTGVGDAMALDASDVGDARDANASDADVPMRRRKSLVIAIDGMRSDALEFAETPHWDSLVQGTWSPGYRGAYSPVAETLYDAPTMSGPNHVTIMTGKSGAQHGITGNSDLLGGDFETHRHYLRLIEEADSRRNTATFFTWSPDASITSGADLIVDSDDGGNTRNVVAVLQERFTPPEDASAREWAPGISPDALFLFLDDVDHAGHADGFEIGVVEYIASIEAADLQLGAILAALQERPTFEEEDWQIVVTTDHGGYGTSHGAMSAPCHTIPMLIVGRSVEQGRLPEGSSLLDVVPTVLQHMQVDMPASLEGAPIGGGVETSRPVPIEEGLVRYYRFESDLRDSAGRADAAIGGGSDAEPTVGASAGRFGGGLVISGASGGSDGGSYITVGPGDDLSAGDDGDFSVSLWFRADGAQEGDPAIISNKDWRSGGNPGWVLSANEGGDDSFGVNYASTSGDRIDLEDIDYGSGEWWFVVVVFRADGLARLYAGDESGGLRFIAYRAGGVGNLDSGLPWNIGQDGTGSYAHNLEGVVDEVAIWSRALSHGEVQRLYSGGDGVELETLRTGS